MRAFDLKDAVACDAAVIAGDGPVCITTGSEQWSYAAIFPLRDDPENPLYSALEMVVRIQASVEAGRIGIAVARPDLREFISAERQKEAAPRQVTFELIVKAPFAGSWLVVRNTAPSGISSRVQLHEITTYVGGSATQDQDSPAANDTPANGFYGDSPSDVADWCFEVFDTPEAHAINRARMEHLASLELPLEGKTVLDVGCGVGHLSSFFVERGCQVTCVDARPENLAHLRSLYPGRRTHFADVEEGSFAELGQYDVVFCYGLIYHTENPIAAFRNMSLCCRDLLLLETVIADQPEAVVQFVDEPVATKNQAIRTFGCRPTSAFVATVLNRLGFFVYTTNAEPDFPDFHFERKADSAWQRNGHLLRRIFVASRTPIHNRHLALWQDASKIEESVPGLHILKQFQPWAGLVPAGFHASFLGGITRAMYWDFPEEIRRIYDRERYEVLALPEADDNICDWVGLLDAVWEAESTFVMAALGAGWGRWLVSAALACKPRDLPFKLIGVEAEPTHFQWMTEHFRDNHLDPEEHELIEAAAAGKSGQAWFHRGKSGSWYGQSVIRDPELVTEPREKEMTYKGEHAELVRTVDLAEIIQQHDYIDYLHMDIQGAELEVLAAHPQVLQQKVKRVLVGTHSTEIEYGLRILFSELGWRCQNDIPLNSTVHAGNKPFTVGDGVQVWINPELGDESLMNQSVQGTTVKKVEGVFDLNSAVVHDGAKLSVVVETDLSQWSYAARFQFRSDALAQHTGRDTWGIRIDASITKGCVGALFVADDLVTALSNSAERGIEDPRGPMILVLDRKPDCGWLILRNNAAGLNRSECLVNSVEIFRFQGVPKPN